MTTKLYQLWEWLRANGPAAACDIKTAGFKKFENSRDRMLKYGSIEMYQAPNPNSGKKHARIVTTLYVATDKPYTPPKGKGGGLGPRPETWKRTADRKNTRVAKAKEFLEQCGYEVKKIV